MELIILAYIAGLLTWNFIEKRKCKMESSINIIALAQSVKNIEHDVRGINFIKKDIQDLNDRFKQRGF